MWSPPQCECEQSPALVLSTMAVNVSRASRCPDKLRHVWGPAAWEPPLCPDNLRHCGALDTVNVDIALAFAD